MTEPASPIGDGGGGGPSAQRKDADLIRRAIRERWPIPEDIRQAIPEYLGAIVAGAEDPRARVAAAKALIEADKVNLEQEKRDLQIPERHDVTTNGQPLPAAVSVTVLQRIDTYTAAIEGAADRAGEGGPPGDGA